MGFKFKPKLLIVRICAHCELGYEEDEETGEPMCCSMAYDDWETWKRTKDVGYDKR